MSTFAVVFTVIVSLVIYYFFLNTYIDEMARQIKIKNKKPDAYNPPDNMIYAYSIICVIVLIISFFAFFGTSYAKDKWRIFVHFVLTALLLTPLVFVIKQKRNNRTEENNVALGTSIFNVVWLIVSFVVLFAKIAFGK